MNGPSLEFFEKLDLNALSINLKIFMMVIKSDPRATVPK